MAVEVEEEEQHLIEKEEEDDGEATDFEGIWVIRQEKSTQLLRKNAYCNRISCC